MRTLSIVVLLATSALAQSVSDGTWSLTGASGPGVQPAPATTLNSLTVTPAIASQQNGSAAAFTATGTYSDNSTQNLTTSATWSSGNSVVATLGSTSTTQAFNCSSAGTSTIRATIGSISGTASLTCTAPVGSGGNAYCTASGTWVGPTTDGPANLPTACYYTALSGTPSPGTVRGPVNTVAAFNSAYAAAACGDVIQIAAGSSFTGPVTLSGKGCDDQHYITIESTGVSNASFPVEGVRATPCISSVASLPNRPSYPCSSPALLTAQFVATSSNSSVVLTGADHIRFIGIEFTRVSTPGALIYSLVDLSATGATQTNHIIFDRVWMHGINQDGNFPQTAATDTSTTRALFLGQSNHVAVIDSYISDIYDNGATASNGNTDAQCVGGGVGSVQNSGWGIYKFVNNHCEGASEGLILGGDVGPALSPSGCRLGVNCNLDVPTNIEVRGNYFFAPNSWNGNTASVVATGWPNRKNGIEFKTGAYVFVEGNVFENCWYSSQPYCYVIDFAPKNQMYNANDPGHCPSCVVQDFVARYNYGYNYPGPYLALYTTSYVGGCAGCGQTLGRRGSIHDNLVGDKMNRGQLSLTGFDCTEFMATAGPITDISMRHNTCVNSFRSAYLFGASASGQLDRIVFQDNLMSLGQYGSLPGTGSGCDHSGQKLYVVLNNCVNGTTHTWTFDHNAHFNWDTANSGSTLGAGFPTNGNGAGNWFYAGSAGPQFASYGTGDSGFNPANYQLLSTSPLHNAASDGKDVGVDIPTLLTKIAGVRL